MSELPKRVSGARPPQGATVPTHLQCSSCSQPLFNGFQTPRRRREVGRLKVLCPNLHAGCSAALSWSLMDQHLDSCDFQALLCELCGQQVTRRDMQRHSNRECLQRKERCGKCTQQVIISEMESRHRNLESDVCCPMFSAACPHCRRPRLRLDRNSYLAHLSECPEKPVECKYSHLGCKVRVRRSELDNHYQQCTDSHMELLDSVLIQSASEPQAPVSVGRSSLSADNAEVAEANRRVGNLVQKFKRLQVNVANWAQSTVELDELVDKFGGVDRLRTLLSQLDERSRCAELLQQQVQALQQQVQVLEQQAQRGPQRRN